MSASDPFAYNPQSFTPLVMYTWFKLLPQFNNHLLTYQLWITFFSALIIQLIFVVYIPLLKTNLLRLRLAESFWDWSAMTVWLEHIFQADCERERKGKHLNSVDFDYIQGRRFTHSVPHKLLLIFSLTFFQWGLSVLLDCESVEVYLSYHF